MDILLKQRMVGAIVLISLGVIFIPMFLSGKGGVGDDAKSNIPPVPKYEIKRPPVAQSVLDAKQRAELKLKDRAKEQLRLRAESEKSVATKAAQTDTAANNKQAAKPAAKPPVKSAPALKQSKPVVVSGWVIQAGSFKERKNANQLRDRLRASGFVAFVEPRKGGTSSYRVRVGPERKQSQAEELQKQLLKKEKIKGLVMRYPEK